MKIKTSELQGIALDWAVAKCEGKIDDVEIHAGNLWYGRVTSGFTQLTYSTDWAQGGPIIERGYISVLSHLVASWRAHTVTKDTNYIFDGPTPLIAAMRCYVASKLGDEIEVPDGLEG